MRALAFVTLVVALQLALLWPRERVIVMHSTTSRIAPMPTPLPIEDVQPLALERAQCPPPRRDVPATKLTQPPEQVDYVRPSITNTGWIAAWNDTHVFVSTDAGATWKRVSDGDGEVRDVNFDCFGRPIVARGTIAELDDAHDVVVLGGGPDMVFVGAAPRNDEDPTRGRLLRSRDGGRTWQIRDLVESWEMPVYGRQYEDASIVAIVHEGDCGGQTPVTFEFDRTLARIEDSTKLADYDELLSREGGIDGVEAYRIDTSIIEGPTPIIVANGHAWRYVNHHALELPVQVTTESGAIAADAAGRIWAAACGHLALATREPPGDYCD
jgi:hypothetical protein